ncbi:hypothetical protein BJX66DRAFT_306597 [Aspergillus keveii]|uniref:Uncharacterized protein n=1 Tax=Aspergillus keveii TaxID=714993 RepID=A0ABR4G200_9EURO
MSVTAASDLSFTTPYVQPGACWDLVGGHRGTTVTDGTTFYKEATDLYTECLPPSWQTIPPESRYSPSPAVCPQGWRYWDIATSEVESQVVTTAWCCDYYKDLYRSNDYPLEGYSKPCVQNEGEEIHVHTPWHITWQESDRRSLRYEPPTVDPGMMIPTWLPGVIGAGSPEQMPLPTPSEPEPSVTTPLDSTPLSSLSPAVPSPTSPDSTASSSIGGGSSPTQGSSTSGSGLEEQNGSSTSTQGAERTSTGDEPSTTHTGGGASIHRPDPPVILAAGLALSVALGAILAFAA